MFPDDIIEMLVSADHDEDDVNGENCESVKEEFWIDMISE